ncbi:zinc/manganese transport system ATP-binding protein [Nakamurella panacisegetis]|uniref:Zinc/manganese transport system ATP-binding protein n=1 Tax=Nakamurella panacisegetis TaxID=1090615 RepID=A0A1H0JE09_9ACTN|nr:ABC transporter ATP-binding protein [Nakamurella panacisegetis]SDO41988.1 zinc/manganese transport system ATP-binding protein [Nakamurella panacisegetis]
MREADSQRKAVVELEKATLAFGDRTLWSDLDLIIESGQFVAVLGANGAGKTSLLKVLLGEQSLNSGTVRIAGSPVRRGSDVVGYVPQRVGIDSGVMVKARDVVRMGLDGHRWGLPVQFGAKRRAMRRTIDEMLAAVGATAFADAPVSMLSGGELQRIRIAEALACDPDLLICDEPLAALDLRHQQEVAALIDRRRREHDTAVIFVTHEINPILPYVDQVLYLAGGRFRLGPPDEVMTSASLSALYDAPVDVISAHGRLVVVAANDMTAGLPQSLDDHAAHSGDGALHGLHDHGHHDPADRSAWRR